MAWMSASARSLTMPNPSEPLVTHVPARQEWVDDEGGRAARAHQSFMSNNLSSNTIWKMQDKNNIALADADGGGTIDKDEFAQLMKSAGGGATNAQDMALLFAQVDYACLGAPLRIIFCIERTIGDAQTPPPRLDVLCRG